MGNTLIGIEKKKVFVHELQAGMYISELDRPWQETPYLLQGFSVKGEEDIYELKHYCEYVYIDEDRSTQLKYQSQRSLEQRRETFRKHFPDRKLETYQDNAGFKQEMPKARHAVQTLSKAVNGLMSSIRHGAPIEMAQIKSSITTMVDSTVRNPDATMWLARLKGKDDYAYKHAVSCSIWGVALGRQIGLPAGDLRTIAASCMLFDIGKLRFPDEVLKKSLLNETESYLMEKHVQLGVNVLKVMPGVSKDALETVKYHHERWDGSGYPDGLVANKIPIMAQIAGLVDTYDAMTSERSYAKAISPSSAVRRLYAWRNKLFQEDLVEEFIQAIGLYPAGTIVELSTKEVGVVAAEYRANRLRPKVLLLLDHNKIELGQAEMVDLMDLEDDRGRQVSIRASLEPGAYDININSDKIRAEIERAAR